jgi:predicted enzyme related to lactoylglutathione lyase
MIVEETFFSLEVRDMERATRFYVDSLGATVAFATPGWTSIHIAGVRIGLFLHPEKVDQKTGLHFTVRDIAAVSAGIVSAGGKMVIEAREVGPDVVIADLTDTEGNGFALRRF